MIFSPSLNLDQTPRVQPFGLNAQRFGARAAVVEEGDKGSKRDAGGSVAAPARRPD